MTNQNIIDMSFVKIFEIFSKQIVDKYIETTARTITFVIVMTVVLFPSSANAFKPECRPYANIDKNYCIYTGIVKRIYVNNSNVVLLYFDELLDVDAANDLGMEIKYATAAGYKITDNPDFAKYLYTTALAAQASGREITINMQGNIAGYLKIIKIWLNAN